MIVYRSDRQFDCNTAKGYATYKNAEKKVKELLELNNEHNDRAMIIEENGRFYPVFILDYSKGGYVCRYSHYGFLQL